MATINLGIGSGERLHLSNHNGLTRRHLAAAVHNLCSVNRYIGSTGATWSVGQHLWMGGRYFDQLGMGCSSTYFRIHDLHEGIIGDTTRPVKKHILERTGKLDVLSDLESGIDRQIYELLFVDPLVPGGDFDRAVKRADELALLVEMDFFMNATLDRREFEHEQSEFVWMREALLECLRMSPTKVMFQLATALGLQRDLMDFLLESLIPRMEAAADGS